MRSRRIPQKREPKKKTKPNSLKKGQKVKLAGEKAKATVMKPPKARGNSAVIRVKRTHKHIPKKAPFGMGQLILKRKELVKEWRKTGYGSSIGYKLDAEIRAIDRELAAMEKAMQSKTVTLTLTEKVPIENLRIKVKQKPIWQRVSETQRRQQREKTLTENAKRDYRSGSNPKRILRKLAKKGVRPKRFRK